MKRMSMYVIALFIITAVVLSACGAAATSALVPPTSVLPTSVPPTAIPSTTVSPTATPGPVTLTVSGQVDSELQLTDAALHAMTVVTLNLVHPKNGATDYTGVRLNDLLTKAGVKTGATIVTFTASDGFTNSLDLATLHACADCLLAFDPTTPGVYNLAMPGQTSGKAWVNGLVSITISMPEPVTLTITGLVNKELHLTFSELRGMTWVVLVLVHPKNGAGLYSGVRLIDLLNLAGIKAGATTVTFTASDGFVNDVDLATVRACFDCLVAFDPTTAGVYNLAFPGQTSGKAWVNGLVSITVK